MSIITSGFIARAGATAARHYIPSSTVAHPTGVIIPDDAFMTMKLRDPSYVPYCIKRAACGRVRRTEFGFECPCCGNRMNFDLTHYDGNANVQYEQAPTISTEATQ
jgi:hypothetical protein